ncbi:DUF998 domain-containing protein [Peterkaempfera griseoplana]|uniref:DUF998 domain-containing protein n=1 Tax=Peterkaempfera griseoplana TaxID=66896 RepID=UPI0006E3289F|nr:DUF998 domain-containing protein [Peterkaempfera griseoplana]
MTCVIDTPVTATATTSARPRTRALLAGGVAAGPLFLGTGLVQGLTRDGFDFTRNAISQLSLGGLGWIQRTSFVLTGLLVIAGAAGVGRVLRDRPREVRAARLIGVFGASFLLAAAFTADPGRGFPAGTPDTPTAALSWHGALHMVSGAVGYLALCAALLVLARHFAAQHRPGWAAGCRVVPLAVVAGFAGSSSAVLAFTLGAGLGLLWLAAVSVRLTRA